MSAGPASPPVPTPFRRDGRVEVAVVVVTYESRAHIGALLDDLRHEAETVDLRVVVADNSSKDGTLEAAARHEGVIAVPTGGNLGYAGGLNVAMRHVGAAESVLVLNPDLRVGHGSVSALLRRMRGDDGIGAVVPLIRDADGALYESLRREPSLLRAASDAAFGRVWRGRPGALSEYVRTPDDYARPRRVDWATGAAVLLRAQAATEVGAWDERFFLYSEETDFFRRLRDAGWQVWFEPEASVVHTGGGSGVSDELVALTVVNRVRYTEKHNPRLAGLFRAVIVAGEHLRRDPTHARARWALRRRSRWDLLPHAQFDRISPADFPQAAVIIPAHDESAVIERTLSPLSPLAVAGRLEVLVVCNGCTDDTARRARAVPGIRVLETEEASKTGALNLGDAHASLWPRLYLDADIVAPPEAIAPVVRALSDGSDDGSLAGRPAFRTTLRDASPVVRSYYRARARMPSTSSALWGAGVYGVSRAGHERLGRFPDVTADDLYVDRLFSAEEKALPDTVPVEVTPPRRAGALVRVLTRARRGPAEQGVDTSGSSLRELARGIRGPLSAVDALVYTAFAAVGRRRGDRAARTGGRGWERDETSREVTGGTATETPTLDHVLLTRFNLPTPGPESLVRAKEGWLRERIDLFERFTVPSVIRQSVRDFRWIVYVDPESPSWLIDRLAPHIERGTFTPLYRRSVTWQDVALDVRALTGARGGSLLTTNLDNDDAIADDFVERLHALALPHRSAAIFLGRGLIAEGDRLYLRRDDENAFCSVVEPWDAPETAWRDWHTLLHDHFPVVADRGRPAWLQVVHGGNVSNRVHGVQVDPAAHAGAFGDLLAGMPSPGAAAVLADRMLASPLRGAREGVRRAGKEMLLRLVGKDGLDRLKERRAAQ